MTAVAILTEQAEPGKRPRYRAIARSGQTQSEGRTAGEALDALTAQLSEDERGTFVVVQEMQPDKYFGKDQMDRLRFLLDLLDLRPNDISAVQLDELKALVAAELDASARRTADLADMLGR